MNELQVANDSAETPSCRMYLSIGTHPTLAAVVGQCVNNVVGTVMSVEDTSAVELCVVEAINNVIKHGCADNPDTVIDVELALFNDKIHVLIRDDGSAIPVDAFKRARNFNFDPSDITELPEGGMGLFLISSCMDDLAYTKDASRRNCLYMTRQIHSELT